MRRPGIVLGLVFYQDRMERFVVVAFADRQTWIPKSTVDVTSCRRRKVTEVVSSVLEVNGMRDVMQLETGLAVKHRILMMLIVILGIDQRCRDQVRVGNATPLAIADERVDDLQSKLKSTVGNTDRSVGSSRWRPELSPGVDAPGKHTHEPLPIAKHQVMPVPLTLRVIVKKALKMEHCSIVGGLDEGIPFIAMLCRVWMDGYHSLGGPEWDEVTQRKSASYIAPAMFHHQCRMEHSMKIFVSILVAMTITAASALAQMPEERVVVGAAMGWMPGAHIGYSISSNFLLGAQLGVRMHDDKGLGSETDVTISPFGKYFFAKGEDFNAYAIAQLYISPGAKFYSTPTKLGSYANDGLVVGAGSQFMATKNVGVWAQVALVNLPFSSTNENVSFGIMAPAIGIDWYLDLD